MPVAAAISAAGALAASAISTWYNSRSQASANAQNYAAQKEFAQNGISWTKADAERAGINPIYALGASSTSFSPSFQGSTMDTSGVQNALGFLAQYGSDTRQMKHAADLQTQQIEAQNGLIAAQTDYYRHLISTPSSAGSGSSLSPAGVQALSPSKSSSKATVTASSVKKVDEGQFANALSSDRYWMIKKMQIGDETAIVKSPASQELQQAFEEPSMFKTLANWAREKAPQGYEFSLTDSYRLHALVYLPKDENAWYRKLGRKIKNRHNEIKNFFKGVF